MTDSTGSIVGATVAAIAWLLWALFSDTRRNHGFWVALLLPFALFLIPVAWLAFQGIRGASWLAFLALGRRAEHAEFIRRLRIRSGFFLLL